MWSPPTPATSMSHGRNEAEGASREKRPWDSYCVAPSWIIPIQSSRLAPRLRPDGAELALDESTVYAWARGMGSRERLQNKGSALERSLTWQNPRAQLVPALPSRSAHLAGAGGCREDQGLRPQSNQVLSFHKQGHTSPEGLSVHTQFWPRSPWSSRVWE